MCLWTVIILCRAADMPEQTADTAMMSSASQHGASDDARPAGVKQKKACTYEHGCIGLFGLPENLIISILRYLPTRSKCQAESVCRTFREVLSNPTDGDFVWDALDLHDPLFEKLSLNEFNRWLLRRIRGVLTLAFHRPAGDDWPWETISSEGQRDQHIVTTTLPLLSGLIASEAKVDLDMTWALTSALFATGHPDSESQLWSCMSRAMTRLAVAVTQEMMTEESSAALCQLAKLKDLELHGLVTTSEVEADIALDLPLLHHLVIHYFDTCRIRLSCPELDTLRLQKITLGSFCGMPSRIRKVCLYTVGSSVPLQELLPVSSAKLLEHLVIDEGFIEADPAAVRELCLNGKLKRIRIESCVAIYDAFAVNASWSAVPQTLQYVILDLPLKKGIPMILEQLSNLIVLSLTHKETCSMHLDRPLDPFLDMPRLEKVKLVGPLHESDALIRGTASKWTPAALRFLGLAEARIRQMQMTPPGRTITLIY